MKKIKIILLTCTLYFFVYGIQVVLVHKFVNPLITPLMVIRFAEGIFEGDKNVSIHKSWKSLDEISPNMVCAVFVSEDQSFYEHHGFNWEGIKQAMEYNRKHKGKKFRGGSTISQQTAKNVFLIPSRTWIRKGVEVYYTFLIETLWSKNRILEVYLNVIETGDGVYGVEAASRKYYNRSAKKLTRTQAASIACILPAPLRWSPVKPNKYVAQNISRVSKHMTYFKLPEEYLKH